MRLYQIAVDVTLLYIRDASTVGTTLSPSSYNDSDSSPTGGSFGDNFNADPCRVYSNCDECVHDVCSAKYILTKQSTSVCLYCPYTDPPTPSGGCVSSNKYQSYCWDGPSPAATASEPMHSRGGKRRPGDPMDLKDANFQQCTGASHSEGT